MSSSRQEMRSSASTTRGRTSVAGAAVSFSEYHASWRNLATTKASVTTKTRGHTQEHRHNHASTGTLRTGAAPRSGTSTHVKTATTQSARLAHHKSPSAQLQATRVPDLSQETRMWQPMMSIAPEKSYNPHTQRSRSMYTQSDHAAPRPLGFESMPVESTLTNTTREWGNGVLATEVERGAAQKMDVSLARSDDDGDDEDVERLLDFADTLDPSLLSDSV